MRSSYSFHCNLVHINNIYLKNYYHVLLSGSPVTLITEPPIVPKAKRKATTESPFKNNKGFINPSEIKKSLIPKKWVDEARQFYDDLVYAGNSPIVAQRETAKRFGTIRAMSASKAGTREIPEALAQEARKYKSADDFIKSKATLLHWSPKWVVEDFSKWKWLSTTWDINNPTYHFTNDIEKAKLFSSQWELDNWNKVKNTPWIKPRTNLPNPWITKAYLDIKNPYVRGKWWDLSADFIKKLKSEWYDGIINDYGNWKEYIVFNTSQIKTESQLKQIYEQANKKK